MSAASEHTTHPDAWAAMPAAQRAVLAYEVEQFLYDEAAMLDARRYRDWLSLLADDLEYWMPIRRTVTVSDLASEFTKIGDMAFFDDDRQMAETRVKKLEAGSAWSEDPPSRSRHFVTNIRITGLSGDELTAESCICVYRTRLNTEVDTWTGRRVDGLRRTETGLRLFKRHIFLDQTLIRSTNMSTLF